MNTVLPKNKRSVTLLIPCHNEGGNISKLYEELCVVFSEQANYLFSILFVDDGSQDNTVQLIEGLIQKDARVELIELSRNFGKEVAVSAGIDHVQTDAVLIMDADLQHPPHYIPQFLFEWEKGFEIVSTKRTEILSQPLLKKAGSYFFYWILNKMSKVEMVSQTTDFRLLDRIVVNALKEFREKNRMVRGIIDWMGFKKTVILFVAPERFSGTPSYNYNKLIGLAINGITSFSLFPLKIAGYLGLLITCIFSLLLIYMSVDHFIMGRATFSSISFVIVVNSIFIGMVLICLGLIALYIGNIHTEVVDRPLYLSRKKILRANLIPTK